MADREKVIRGLECCLPPHDPDCDLCPYDSIDLRCRAKLCDDVLALLKAQEPPTNECISSAIECLLHPQDADDSDMAKAIDTAVRAMRLLKAQERIDAIPVEWLEEHDGVNIIDSDGNIYARRRRTVEEALSMWQKEQEAR